MTLIYLNKKSNKLLDKGIDLAKEEEYIIAKYFINHPWKNDQILAKFNEKYEN